MASIRKRYRSEASNGPAVAAVPQGPAEQLPPQSTEKPASETNPVEQKPSPIEQAAQSALKQRLAEMENAAGLVRDAQQQQSQFAAEPRQATPEVPPHVRKWIDENPRYLSDPIAQAELNLALTKVVHAGKTWNDPDFVETVERHLGLRQQAQPNGNGNIPDRPPVTSHSQPITPPRPAATPRQQQPIGPPVSAPPIRDAPSMTTGRPTGGPT